MPYIRQDQRDQWTKIIDALLLKVRNNSGKLKYFVTTMALKIATPQCYSNYERASGFLCCLSSEFERRVPGIKERGNNYQTYPSIPFDMDTESLAINTNLVHGISKDHQGGHSNYITSVLFEKLIHRGYFEPSEIYSILTDTIENFYHNQIAPYEDIKIQENGDVYFQALLPWHDREEIEDETV